MSQRVCQRTSQYAVIVALSAFHANDVGARKDHVDIFSYVKSTLSSQGLPGDVDMSSSAILWEGRSPSLMVST